MLAQLAAALVLDGAGLVRQVLVQELAEGPLADEADAGRVLFWRWANPISAAMRAHPVGVGGPPGMVC